MFDYRMQFAEATDSLARIHFRPSGMVLPTGATYTGTLTGPQCRYARTLPAVFPVRDVDGTAEVLITEPCYWTADLPFLYDLRVDVRQEGAIVASSERSIGLRRLSFRGSSVFVEGKRFVFRAAHLPSDKPIDWQAWRAARLAMYAVDPHDELCRAASEQGVWIIAETSAAATANRVMNWPAVAVVAPPTSERGDVERGPGGPLIAGRETSEESAQRIVRADIMVHVVQNVASAKRDLVGRSQPVFAVRSIEGSGTLAAARAECEQLQRDLSPELNLAGYIV